ncbi:MAG TPA: hypothetical protein DCQ64_30270 [Candidatus Rokubacteria bacterium]|nr:hypothetical protein [Candidatus Rokubacteria bacterium]
MDMTKLHEAIASARGVDPRHPSLPFMEVAAAVLEEHELRLSILSGHIIPERCKPLAPHRGYYERCKPHFEATPTISEEPQARYGGPGARICPTCRKVPAACVCAAVSDYRVLEDQADKESLPEGPGVLGQEE